MYLNSNATGATPLLAQRVLEDYWRTLEQWRDEHWRRWFVDVTSHADEIAALLGAPAGSVVCDTTVATLLSRVMSCFDFRERPGVVTTDLEFPAVPFILRAFGRYGAILTVVSSGDGIAIDAELVAQAIHERTQLVCVSHATLATGALVDVAPIVRRAREVGALVALDVYQSIGAVPIDVSALDVDFVFGGAHKWLCGSCDSAFLYVRPSLARRLRPAAAGGTPAVLPSLLSRPGLAIVRDIGIDTIRARSLACTDHLIARADQSGLRVVTPRPHDRRGGIVALRFQGDAAVARALIATGFACSYRDGIRIAPHFYNTDEEVDRFMDAVARFAHAAS